MHAIPVPDGTLTLDQQFLNTDQADTLYQQLSQELNWRQDSIRMFGRIVTIPRLQVFQGEPGIRYRYSGLTLETESWHPAINALRQEIEQVCGYRFNSVLINFYRNGQDGMGWHSDDEPELGPNPTIASVTLGQPRRFLLRHKSDKAIPQQELLPEHGSLLIMANQLQHHWQHSIPKTKRIMQGRINLTFRLTH